MKVDPGLASWLQLTLTPGIGSATIRSLLGKLGLPEGFVSRDAPGLSGLLPQSTLAALRSDAVLAAVDRASAWAAQDGHHVLTLADEAYPRALLETPDPPALLYLIGRVELLRRESIAVVGSRNATAQGEQNAQAFARALSENGLTIVSGLAMGVDAAAHRGGLGGPGSTIAVLGTGVDVVYPRRNDALAREIAQRGLLVSEFPLGTGPLAANFPRRNRIISGLCRGCLVVEAAAASGSLITARAAADQGRDVFAIPGSIHSPLSKGCHALIKSGAKLVESADDVLAEFSGFQRSAFASTMAMPPETRGAPAGLLAHMGHDPVDVDMLCERAGLSAKQVSSELLRLELDGEIAALPGGLYQRLGSGKAGKPRTP
ncbi:MAG TPA: DNA-processing protein DprA [Burkholderiales bacterium]|nr:DNA-processing protein DprA [Burkholderiales bacterium]